MRIARKSRNLSGDEINLAAQVFQDSLPSWGRIFITDRLGPIPDRELFAPTFQTPNRDAQLLA
jgi:hypothetical protein